MRLTVRHLTGSRAGQQQTFDASEVTIGRHPTSMILFDPDKDRVVSGKHAVLSHDQNGWLLRDLGSSNGTFIEGNAVTSRLLKPGDVIQLGKNGPQVQVEFESDEIAPTVVVPLNDLRSPQPPREGKTLIMMMPGAGGGAAAGAAPATPVAPAYVPPPPAKKKGGIGRALAIVGAALLILIVGAAALAIAIRNSNIKKRRAAQVATTTAGGAAATDPAAVARQKAEADRINQQIAAQQQEIAQQQANLQKTESQGGGATNQEAEDLKRQLAESQALLEQMTRELQTKNDEMSRAQSKPAKTEVRYVPAPAARDAAPKTRTPVPTTSVPAAQAKPLPAATAPAVVAQASAPLFTGKKLKKKVLVTPLPPEIPPANMPSGAARDLASLLTSALISTGDFVAGPKGQASVSVMVTNYRAQAKEGVNVAKTADSARKLGKLFGKNVPSAPGDVRSVAYDAAMSVRVRLYDPSGRVIAEVEPSAEASDRKTKTSLADVSFNEVAFSDTAAGDVARKVIGDAIDTVRSSLSNLEWSTTVQSQSKQKVTLAAGRNANLEPGDVFEIIDGKKAVTRVRITSVTETSSDAEFIGGGTAPKVGGKSARYVGSENSVSTAARERVLTVRIKTPAYAGPGDSFRTVKELRVGQKMKFQYAVGSWARATDGGTSFWVPLAKVQIAG